MKVTVTWEKLKIRQTEINFINFCLSLFCFCDFRIYLSLVRKGSFLFHGDIVK